MQWLQDVRQINADNLNSISHKAGTHFRNKKREYLKDKINLLKTHSKYKNIRGLCRRINECKKGHQPKTNLVKGEKHDLLADSHKTLKRRKNYYYLAVECTWGS
jgi:ABC-type lipoprotein export system ATPase subunit